MVRLLVLSLLCFQISSLIPSVDLNGSWVVLNDMSTGVSSFGSAFVAVQDSSTLKITRTVRGQSSTATYRLDGSENKNDLSGGKNTSTLSRLSWDGSRLVIRSRYVDSPDVTVLRTLWLDARGCLNIVTITLPAGEVTKTLYSRNR